MRTLVTVAAVATALPALAATPAPGAKVTSTPVASTSTTITGQAIDVPQHPMVDVAIATFPPGAQLAVHKHPYPHYVYVLEGTLTVVNSQTNETKEFHQGEFFAEMNNTFHFGKNATSAPVKLLVIDQMPSGTTANTIPR